MGFFGTCRSVVTIGRFAFLASLLLLSFTEALEITYCSSDNTGGSAIFYTWQSNGSCDISCKDKYAFAVLQGQNCYCSNWVPANQVSTSRCNIDCPGFPSEKCGNPDAGLFGYYKLDRDPSGTVQPSTSTSVRPSSTPQSTTNRPQTTSAPQSSWIPTPSTVVTTVFGGSIQTIIITPTASPPVAQTTNATLPEPADSFWNNSGKVAGTFVAVALVIVAIIAAVIFFMVRRLRNRNDSLAIASNADDDQHSADMPYMTDRRKSNLALTSGGTGALTRGSSNEKTSTTENTPASMSRRTSIPMVHDQRLNPAALWNSNHHENGSHVSIASFRDDRDYSRPVLHVRNPDID